jgi:hypothetical protein
MPLSIFSRFILSPLNFVMADLFLNPFPQLEFMTTIGLDVAKVLKNIKDLGIEQHLERVHKKFSDQIGWNAILCADMTSLSHVLILVSSIALDSRIDKLVTAKDTSWNPARVCLPDTRTALRQEIWEWITSIDATGSSQIADSADIGDTAKIFFLTSVAGAGKSAISHTIAERCHQEHLLVSSFFFDRNVTDRRSILFSTIARDLAGHDIGLRKQISQAIELDNGLPTAPGPRQFRDLILGPCRNHRVAGILAIVIDALDEGYDRDLVDVLCNEVPKLPGNFRIFLTSREGQEFNLALSQKRHVHSQSIMINEQANLDDIAIFVRVQLERVAEWTGLSKDWPGPGLTEAFTQKAEGLFLWVSTVCEYLLRSTDPSEELRSLISNESSSGLPAEEKMDELYTTILQSCNWRDKAFSKGYNLLVGAVMAAKTPLSGSALQLLHDTSIMLPVNTLLRPVSSLLTGVAHANHPIQPLHLSFRDFITSRAQLSATSERFYINEKEHSGRLALLCLVTLNKNIKRDPPGLGYLEDESNEGIPVIDEGLISEEVWYACRFWTAHIVDVDNAGTDLIDALKKFLSNHVAAWIEICASRYQFQTLVEMREWTEVSFFYKVIIVVACLIV